jgi:hypothetical protein
MDPVPEDRFVVFVRSEATPWKAPEAVEQAVAECSTYAEARRIRGAFLASAHDCVVRYVGTGGGGD